MAKISLGNDGAVDEEKVKNVLAELENAFPSQVLRQILKFYEAAIAREIRANSAKIEFAGALPAGTAEKLAEHFSKIYKKTIVPVPEKNDEILGGIRVQIGDDVFDASLAGTLKKLKLSLAS